MNTGDTTDLELAKFQPAICQFFFRQKRTSRTYLSPCYLHMTQISLFLYEIPRVIHPSDEYTNSPAILQKKCYIYGVFSHFIERPNTRPLSKAGLGYEKI